MELTDSAAAIDACLAAGVEEFVICGGARNVELVAGLAALPSPVRLWNFPEERSAAFFALGRSRAAGKPAAVVTTSGTAVAELLPAAIEAYYSRVPLVLVSADRPDRYRGSGAPQAIEQVGIFGDYADDDPCEWSGDRPLHLNVCLEEPTAEQIASVVGNEFKTSAKPAEHEPCYEESTKELREFLADPGQLFVMLGCVPASWREPVHKFLDALGASVYAEATSGLRESGLPPGSSGERVLRIGGVPSCRTWRDLEASDTPVFSVAPNGLPGLARPSQVVRSVDWSAVTVASTERSQKAGEPAAEPASQEAKWFRALSERIPQGALVFLGNSLPIREWNQFATYEDRDLRCFANRGANGIDGLVSTFLGMAEGEDEAWIILGDLSAVYDLAAPWVLPQMSGGNRRIVVINNGGGKIFRNLPALAGASERAMAMIENPHATRFSAWAEMWGFAYRCVGRDEELSELPNGDVLIEVIIEPEA